ncbi:hypothetical protein ACK6TC_12265 [Enterobacter hormaechei]|uniref:hypothetical protein n=1 Tax=Enterobacter hormaechei TaxID=158836 RepID=UPI0027EB9218|nr:hypothetical protein [Enterobacter hormaechei subsp. steigerwaltii]
MSNIDKQAVQAVADLKAGYTLGHADVEIIQQMALDAVTLLDELEALKLANAAQDDHINQQQDRIDLLEKGNNEAARQINSWRRLAKQNIAEREKDVSELNIARKRIAELEAREVNGRFPLPKDSSQGWKIDPEFIGKIQDAIGYDEECQCWEGSPSMEMVEAVLIAAAAIKMDERG